MSDEEKSTDETAAGTAAANEQAAEQQYGDEHTTEPNAQDEQTTEQKPEQPSKWEMPKPVFQKTSGYLPQGFVKDKDIGASEAAVAQGEPSSPDEPPSRPSAKAPDRSEVNFSAPAAPAAAVEPQPDLSEQLIPEEPELETAPEPARKIGGVRASMLVLGLIAILAFIAVFVTVIYILFFKGSGGTNPF